MVIISLMQARQNPADEEDQNTTNARCVLVIDNKPYKSHTQDEDTDRDDDFYPC